MAHDGQHPGTRAAASEAADRAEGPQTRVLDHVLGVGPISGEPARQRVGLGQMGQHHAPEALAVTVAAHLVSIASSWS
jgi:hypothetical protein